MNKKYIAGTYIVFSKTQEKIVNFLYLKKDGASISEIAKGIKLARTSVYNSLEDLIKRKLISSSGFNYMLTNNLISKKVFDLNFDHQINLLMKEMLSLKKGEIIYSIESQEEIEELFTDKKWLKEWQRSIVEKGIVLKGISDKKALQVFRDKLDENLKHDLRKRGGSARFTDENIKGPCALVSFRDSVIYYSRNKEIFYRIDNKYVASFTQSILDSYYNNLNYEKIV